MAKYQFFVDGKKVSDDEAHVCALRRTGWTELRAAAALYVAQGVAFGYLGPDANADAAALVPIGITVRLYPVIRFG